MQALHELVQRAKSEIETAASLQALDAVRVTWLGKKGILTQRLKQLSSLPQDQRPAWPHLRLHPLTFDRLSLVDTMDGSGSSSGRGAELWVGLARAALAGDDGPAQAPSAAVEPEAATAEPAVVAQAIDEHPRLGRRAGLDRHASPPGRPNRATRCELTPSGSSSRATRYPGPIQPRCM